MSARSVGVRKAQVNGHKENMKNGRQESRLSSTIFLFSRMRCIRPAANAAVPVCCYAASVWGKCWFDWREIS